MITTLRAILQDERNAVANMANAAAILFNEMPDINWAGFYVFDGTELVLGPFQGRPACIRIQLGSGVCGTAASQKKTIVVPDVHEFPGHIACDAFSRSEVVIPMVQNGEILGVLDVDSPSLGRFSSADAAMLEEFANIVIYSSDWGNGADQNIGMLRIK